MSEVFQKNLGQQAELKFSELCDEVGVAITKIAKKYGLDNNISGISFRVLRDDSVYIDNGEHRKSIILEMQKNLLNDFQNSLDNFAWAVENQSQN